MIKFYVIYRLKAIASENFQPLFQKSSLKMHFPPEKCKKNQNTVCSTSILEKLDKMILIYLLLK